MAWIKIPTKWLEMALQWEPILPAKEWCEKYLKVLDGAHQGDYTTKYTPYLDCYFELLDKAQVELIAFMSASQVGKTLAGTAFVLYTIDTAPSNKLIIIPNEKDIPTYLKNKFDVFLKGCQKVSSKIIESLDIEKKRGRNALKEFPGGQAIFLGSSNVKSLTAQHILCDEVADFAAGAVNMVKERFKTYRGKGGKLVAISTMQRENDEIYNLFMMCEVKFQYWLYCEHCGGHFYPEVKHLKIPTEEEFAATIGLSKLEEYMLAKGYLPYIKANSFLGCPHCQGKITGEMRQSAIIDGKCRMVQVVRTGVDEKTKQNIWIEDPTPKTKFASAGLDVNSFVSGLVPLSLIVEEYYSSLVSIANLQKFYIGWANRIYYPNIITSEQHRDLLLLGSGLTNYTIPTDTIFLTLTIDTQKIGYWYLITAFSPNEIATIISEGWISDEDSITRMIQASYTDKNGDSRALDAIGIDRQGIQERTAEVDAYCNWLAKQGLTNVFPLIGREKDRNNRVMWPVKIDPTKSDLAITAFAHNTSYAKFTITNYLARSVDNAINKYGYENRLIYINDDLLEASINSGISSAESLEKQLTSEHFINPVDKNGRVSPNGVWVPTYEGRPNHELDCLVMAFNIATMKKVHLAKSEDVADYDKMSEDIKNIYEA